MCPEDMYYEGSDPSKFGIKPLGILSRSYCRTTYATRMTLSCIWPHMLALQLVREILRDAAAPAVQKAKAGQQGHNLAHHHTALDKHQATLGFTTNGPFCSNFGKKLPFCAMKV